MPDRLGDAEPLPRHLGQAHAEGLVPEPGLSISEFPARPFHGAESRGQADLELMLIRIADERLAGRARGRDPENTVVVVIVGEQVEMKVLAHVGFAEER